MSLRSIWCISTWMRFVEIIRGQPICYIIQPKSINIHLTMQRNKYWFRLLVVVFYFHSVVAVISMLPLLLLLQCFLRTWLFMFICSFMRRNKSTRISLFIFTGKFHIQLWISEKSCELSKFSYINNQQHQDDNQLPVPIAMDRLLSIIC